uniref:Uncharacterized protein n=1 Tax=Utricularia reniformis TaxID=192314 RepID=A0A1Y0AYN5_9LAMI|nr:hypothetical protein AEK19_MT0163 [Utricularia reniformis]ART30260.1 hypothetical protein AEK19_MT0163 [Utricularia reniformis]
MKAVNHIYVNSHIGVSLSSFIRKRNYPHWLQLAVKYADAPVVYKVKCDSPML